MANPQPLYMAPKNWKRLQKREKAPLKTIDLNAELAKYEHLHNAADALIANAFACRAKRERDNA